MKQSQKTLEMHTHFLAKKPKRERPLGRPRYTWEANIKQIFKKKDARVGTVLAWHVHAHTHAHTYIQVPFESLPIHKYYHM
jgi:hypothetical protein